MLSLGYSSRLRIAQEVDHIVAVHIFPNREDLAVPEIKGPRVEVLVVASVCNFADATRLRNDQASFGRNRIDNDLWITGPEQPTNRFEKIIDDSLLATMHAGAGDIPNLRLPSDFLVQKIPYRLEISGAQDFEETQNQAFVVVIGFNHPRAPYFRLRPP